MVMFWSSAVGAGSRRRAEGFLLALGFLGFWDPTDYRDAD